MSEFFRDYHAAYDHAVKEARRLNRIMQLRAGKEYNTKGYYVGLAVQKPEHRYGVDMQGEFITPNDPIMKRSTNPMKNDTGIRLRRMRDTDIYDFFQRWYKRDGHWIYASMGKALEVWKSRGIEGLPPYPGRVGNPMRLLHIDQSKFRKGEWVGYAHGVWHIRKQADGKYYATKREPPQAYFRLNAKTLAELDRKLGDWVPDRTVNPLKFDRCVRDVKRRGSRVNPYAVCTAAIFKPGRAHGRRK